MENLIPTIEKILSDELPRLTWGISKGKDWFGNGTYLKIWAACSNVNIHGIEGQKAQAVSLMLTENFELSAQMFGGCGGRAIYRKPNLLDDKEKYLYQKSVNIPFRTPQKTEKATMAAIRKFFHNYMLLLVENKDVLMHQDTVNYNELLK